MLNKRMLGRLSVVVVLSAAGTSLSAANPDTRLADAAMRGCDTNIMRTLITQKADVNAAQGDGTTPLHWAAYNGNLECAQLLIQHGAKVNATTRIGALTPLLMASRNGRADGKLIEALLTAGADVNQVNAEGTTALMMAAASGSAGAVMALLDHGANVNAKESAHGQTAAMFAAALNRDEALKLLVAHGADLSVTTKVTSLSGIRVGSDGRTSLVDRKAPAKGAALTEEKTEQEARPAPAAAETDGKAVRAATVRELGTSIMGGMTALLYAARDGQNAAAKVLIESGANINQVSESDQTTPLVMAILNGHLDLATYFMEKGADVNTANAAGLAPLYATIDVQWAPHSWYPHPDITQEKTTYLGLMQLLIDKGANVNAKLNKKLWYRTLAQDDEWIDPAGSTAFWRAAKADDLPAMRLLMAHGADPNLASAQGDTPLMVAAGLGWAGNYSANVIESWRDAVKYCVDIGSDVNASDARGYTALHGAAFIGDNDMILYLVSKGANPMARAKGRLVEGRALALATGGLGDTIADMANGPRERSQLHPDTVALLEHLGSVNSHNCRSSECVVPAIGPAVSVATAKESSTPTPAPK